MYHIVTIALGVFAGLWLFVRWAAWSEARWERMEKREVRRAERQRATADHDAKLTREANERAARPPAAPWIKPGWIKPGPWVGFAAVGFWIVFLVCLGFSV